MPHETPSKPSRATAFEKSLRWQRLRQTLALADQHLRAKPLGAAVRGEALPIEYVPRLHDTP